MRIEEEGIEGKKLRGERKMRRSKGKELRGSQGRIEGD